MPVPSTRLGAALFTLSLSLATVSALPAADAAPRSTHAVARSTWFTDPLTTLQRADLVRVPTHPSRYDGKTVQATRALYTTYDGSLAVPVEQSEGHQIVTGQAITFQVPLSFPKRNLTGAHGHALAELQGSLSTATRIRCEGYVRYGGDTPANDPHASRLRAQAMCAALAEGRTDLDTRSVGYGSSRPVVIGGPVSKQHTVRAANRRVVVIVTRTAPAVEPPAQITGLTATAGDTDAELHFTKPDQGSSPILRYEWTTFEGSDWHTLTTTGTDPLSGTVTGLTNGTTVHLVVRAVSADGNGVASNPVDVTPAAAVTVPGAPVLNQGDSWWHYKDRGRAQLDLSIDSPFVDGGSPITGYQMSVGSDPWVDLTWDSAAPHNAMRFLDHQCGTTSASYRVRAVNVNGPSLPSNSILLHNYDYDAFC